MEQIDYGSFIEYFEENGRTVYFAIHPEFSPYESSIMPTGKYFIYCIDPVHGSCHFMIEQDENCLWHNETLPPFITTNQVEWIGERIERHSNDL